MFNPAGIGFRNFRCDTCRYKSLCKKAMPFINSFSDLGQLIYFFEKACAISGYLLGVNPFDQPGVESYKKNMFALLGKPGYEEAKAALEKRLSR